MKLSIIVVSYNTKNLLQNCLSSLKKGGLKREDYEVIVVDNASSDGSVEMVKTSFQKAHLIKNKTNLGFSKANNQAIKKAIGEYVLLLNSDTIIKKHTLIKLTKFMDSRPRAGIASAQLLNHDGSIQQSGGHLPRLSNIAAWVLFLDDLPVVKQFFWSYHKTNSSFYKKDKTIGWVQGAAMIIRKKCLDKIGLLDEKIFMYGEDIDLCIRAWQKKWQVWTVSQAKVYHYGFQSSQGIPEKAIVGEFKALKYIFKKHKASWEKSILQILLKLGSLLRMLIFGTILKDKQKYDIYSRAVKLD